MKRFLFLCLFLLPRLVYAQTVVLNINQWYSLTGPAGANTHFQDVCPPDFFNGDAFDFFSECKWLPIAWSSGFLDPDRNYMYLHGGGHNNYSGNETYRLDLANFAKSRITDPSTPTGSASVIQDCIGTPCVSNSKHTYDGMLWMKKPHRMMIIGGSPARAGGFVQSIWTFDPNINDWVRRTSNFRSSSGGMTVIGVTIQGSDPIFATAYDELHDVVYVWDQLNLFAVDFNANTIRSLTNRSSGLSPFYSTGVYDPKRKVFVVMGGDSGQLFTFDVSAGPTVQTALVDRSSAATTAGAGSIIGSSGPGVQYDPDLDRLVAWGSTSSQNTIYKFDMDKMLVNDTTMLTTVTTTGAPNPIWPPSSANQGVYKRFQYVPKSKLYVYCGDFQANCLAFRLIAPDNTIRIKETSGSTQTNRPVTIGRPFRQGDIANCPTAYISGSPVTTQTDVKNRWSDGSLKFGLISFVVPTMTANSTTTVTFLNGTSCNNTGGLTQSGALAVGFNFNVTMSLTGAATRTASARTMLAANSVATGGIDPSTIAGIPANIVTGLQTYALTDITGQTRPQNGSYDLGAYTYSPLTPTTPGLAVDCTLYAAANGNDSNNGTSPSTPKTLTGASSATVPGSVVCLKGGTYTRLTTFYPAHNGTSSQWITYKAYGDSTPILVWAPTTTQSDVNMIHFFSSTLFGNVQYIAVEGLTLDGQNTSSVGLKCQNSHHLRFTRNTIQNFGGSGIATVTCDYIISDGNLITHTGYLQGGSSALSYNSHQFFDAFTGFHSLAINNVISGAYDTTAHQDGNGIILDLSDGTTVPSSANTPPVLIANNVIFENGSRCIELFVVNRAWVVNNTCYKNTLDTVQSGIGEIVVHDSKDSFIVNNVVYAWNNHNTYQQVGTVSGMTYKTNLGFAGTLNFSPADPTQFRVLDPLFLNAPLVQATAGGQYASAPTPAQLGTGLSLIPGAWRKGADGSVMTNFIIEDRSAARGYDMDPNNDGARALHPIFDCRFYPINNQVECGAILENAWISTTQANSTRDETFTYSMTRGNTSPASVAVNWAGNLSETFSSTHPFTYMSRTHRWFCVSNCPGSILIDHNLTYLASTGLIENFDTSITENAGQVTARKSQWTNSNKTIQGSFDGTNDYIGSWLRRGSDGGGGHPWIGLHTTWDIQYLYNMTSFDQTMEDLFYGNADLHGRLQIHNRELDQPAGRGAFYDNAYSTAHTSPLGRPLSIAARKEVSTQDYSDSCGGTIGADKINTGPGTIEWTSYSPRYAAHHAPTASHYQYLLSGRYFYLEEMQFDASYYLAWAHGCLDNSTSPGSSRQGDKGYYIAGGNNETRGLAWALRSMIYAAITAPDNTPEQTYYQWYVAQNRAILEGTTGVANTDAAHVAAYNYATSFLKTSEGGSPLGEFVRYLDDGGNGVLREDGTPSRNVQNCNGAGFTCAIAPWMENFLLAAMGMGNDGGIDFNNLLAFRAKYNFGFVTGVTDTALGDRYRMPGKVELSYSAAPGNTGQGWMLRWSDILQYMQPITTFSTSAGSDQQYGYINLGAMSFLGGQMVYGVDGAGAHTTMRAAMNADFVAAGSSYVLNVNGSRTPADPDNDSCKWCMLPRTASAPVTIVTPPTPPVAPNAPTMVDVP